MTTARWAARALQGLGILAVLLGWPHAAALSIAPPRPLPLLFEVQTDRLTRDGLLALDRLAVRAAQCPAGDLAVHVQPAPSAHTRLTAKRIAVVQARLQRLGLKLTVASKPLRASASDGGRPRRRDVLLADVGTDEDVWCGLRAGSQILDWAQELGRHVDDATAEAPAFWRWMSTQVKVRELALPLAIAAYCDGALECDRRPALFHWLAAQALEAVPVERRRQWLLALWTLAEDSEVERFRARWSLSPLTVDERAGLAHEMAASGLPWAVIERRLLGPGVMERFGRTPVIAGGPGPHWLLEAAERRGQLDSFNRLIEAAGPAKACFVDDAFRLAAVLDDKYDIWKPHFAHWARGLAALPQRNGPDYLSCNPVARFLLDCSLADADALPRYRAIWTALRQAGVTTTSPGVQSLLAHGFAVEKLQCAEEASPRAEPRFAPVPAR